MLTTETRHRWGGQHIAHGTAAGILACALAAPICRPRRSMPSDLALAGLLVVNAGTVGVAGAPTAPARLLALVPHLPVEFAALSLAGGAYLSAAAVPLRRWFLTRVALASTGMLTAAAYSKPTCNWPPIHDRQAAAADPLYVAARRRGGLVVVTFA